MNETNGTAPPVRKKHQVGGPDLAKDRGATAKQLAAAILEVLAGARTPTEAATALGLSVPRYYQLEIQALRGFLEACEPRQAHRGRKGKPEVETLSGENRRLQRELMRQQALARAAQRAIGLSAPAPVASKSGKKPRQRKIVRALSVAERLKKDMVPTSETPSTPGSSEAT